MTPEELIQLVTVDNFFRREMRRVDSLEVVQARVLQKHYDRSRDRILDKLTYWAGSETFTEARLNFVLNTIDAEMDQLAEVTGEEVRFASSLASEEAGVHSLRELAKMEKKFTGLVTPIPDHAIDVSVEKSNYLVNNFETSLETYNAQLRGQIHRRMSTGVIERATSFQMVGDLRGILGQETWKVQRIVRTELHNIYNKSKIINFRTIRDDYVPDLMKGLIHPMDGRTGEDSKALKSLNPIIPIDDAFRYTYNGQVREFISPPDRPNDRAILVPVRGAFLTEA